MEVVGAQSAAGTGRPSCWPLFGSGACLSFTSNTSHLGPVQRSFCRARLAPKFTNRFVLLRAKSVFQKHFPNSFRATPLLEHLQTTGVTDLIIAGMMTHMCIDTTTRAAADLGFKCHLAHDACATRALSFNGQQVSAEDVQIAYLAALNGLFARVLSTQNLCTEL